MKKERQAERETKKDIERKKDSERKEERSFTQSITWTEQAARELFMKLFAAPPWHLFFSLFPH